MRFAGLVTILLFGLSCGTPRANCTPANCNGCCDSNGMCVPGISNSNCGKGGMACASCGGGTCSDGMCMGGAGGGSGGSTGVGGGSSGVGGGSSGVGGGTSGSGGGTSGSGGGMSGSGGGMSGSGGGNNPAVCGAGATADHLLINEVSVTPTEEEFVEIYNPTAAAIDLTQYFLYGATFVAPDGGTSCHYRDIVTGAQCGGAFNDFSLQFPAGAMIGPGVVQTIAMSGAADYCRDVAPCDGGVFPTYEVRLTGNADFANVPDMRGFADVDGGANTGLLTNASEDLVLFRWDGVAATVKDVDYVIWGTNLQVRTDKTGISSYVADTPVASQRPLAGTAALTTSWQRLCTNEGAETKSAGNGLTFHDETSEPLDTTWTLTAKTPGRRSVGEP